MKLNDFIIVEAKDSLPMIKLSYSESSLAPVLSKDNVNLHFNVLTKNYFKKFNETKDRYQEAGAILHTFWWDQLRKPKSTNVPENEILELIEDKFQTFANFKDQFQTQAMSIHGSGWCYLSKTGEIKLIKNHEIKKDILLILDMFEHSYYLDFGPDKEKYIKEFWKIVNWDYVNNRLIA